MTITNGYATLAALKSLLSITDTAEDAELESMIEAASRQIDAHCGKGRKFWQDANVVERQYYPSSSRRCFVDDISTTTGLVVEVDTADDGTFATSLTIDTEFVVHPLNAAAEYPVQPWTSIHLLTDSATNFVTSSSGRAPLKVTAKFGWSAVPGAVERACLLQAKAIRKSSDATFGTYQLSIDGLPQRIPAIDRTARAQLEPFIRYYEVDDGA